MDSSIFLIALSIFTFLAVIVVAMVSRKKTLDRLHDPKMHRDENKSTLAKDAPDH
ncbi:MULTISPECIES: hypothetical protein [unclassified Yoonia]|uniref:hypothetical protein n=1 Tax=unclassified Yoonia TaxID=2629118 RepID=UPI002AFE8288|nr:MULTISPECIES: hypothetical protein [unclassified Yoonia]